MSKSLSGMRNPGLEQSDAANLVGSALTFDLAQYWSLALKYRFVIIGAFIGALVIAALVTSLTTPTYTATSTLKIDRESERVLDIEDVMPREALTNGEEFFQTQYGLLKSRSLAERVVDSLGLASSDAFLEAMGSNPPERGDRTAAEFAARRREAVIATVMGNLSVTPVRGSRLVNIGFDSPDPALAARVTNAYAENFIQSNLDRRFESSSYARTFLEQQIAQTKAKLEVTERSLVEYASSQGLINVREENADGSGQSQSLAGTNLGVLNQSLADAKTARIAAEQRWRQARGASIMSLPEVLQNPAIQRLTEERARLDAQYQQNDRVYQADWPAQRQLRSQIEELERQISEIAQGVRSSIEGQYIVAANNERALQAQVDGLKLEVLDLRDRSVEYNILQRELDTSRTLYDALLERYKEVGVTGTVASNNVSIVDRAEVPRAPSAPNLLINMALGGLLGLGLGLFITFVLEALDESIVTPDDAEEKLGLQMLGVIPLLDRQAVPSEALDDVRSPMSEAYYSLQTALKFSTPDGRPRSMLFTSSRPAEGKSTSSFATALYLARIGKRVLLIDGDMRNPSMHRLMGVNNSVGMSDLLAGGVSLSDAVQHTRNANLFIISSGPLPPNPVELLVGDRLRTLLIEMEQTYDYIVIDGPPVLGFGDAPLLAAAVGATLFVLESKGTRRAQARGAMRRLLIGEAKILGGVMTKFNTKSLQYGGYDYAYDYDYSDGASRARPAKDSDA